MAKRRRILKNSKIFNITYYENVYEKYYNIISKLKRKKFFEVVLKRKKKKEVF